jgi:spore maturation protein CgeB
MEDLELDRYKKLVENISDLKKDIKKYLHTGSENVGNMSYAEAIKQLAYLRNLQRSTSKRVRQKYAETKNI